MARFRSIPFACFTDEDFVSVSPFARLLYIGLGVVADDSGDFDWNPIALKIKIFPGDNVDVAALLSELEAANLVCRLDDDGKPPYGTLRHFPLFTARRK